MLKNNTQRPNVIRFLPYWQERIKTSGKDVVSKELSTGKTIMLHRKDRMGLLQALGMREVA